MKAVRLARSMRSFEGVQRGLAVTSRFYSGWLFAGLMIRPLVEVAFSGHDVAGMRRCGFYGGRDAARHRLEGHGRGVPLVDDLFLGVRNIDQTRARLLAAGRDEMEHAVHQVAAPISDRAGGDLDGDTRGADRARHRLLP